jgi:hypothetical protein
LVKCKKLQQFLRSLPEVKVQIPPADAFVNVTRLPVQNVEGPPIGAGTTFTVTVPVLKQPEDRVYVIVVVPVDIPDKIPVVVVTSAIAMLAELQVPEAEKLVNVPVEPSHTLVAPPITDGEGLVVTTTTDTQPVPNV